MPKRKRTVEEAVQEKVEQYSQELHHALKKAKGFERQRLAKRLKDKTSTPEKIDRLNKEVVVLKSLDLHQAAYAHLCASLLKFKSIADSPDLPADVKAGPPKPEITEEERGLLHNVTSALYNRREVRDALDKAIKGTCGALGIPVPPKRGKKDKEEKDEKPADKKGKREPAATPEEVNSEKEGNKKAKKAVKETPAEEISDTEAERAISKYMELLGGSSEEESGSEGDDEADPMEITSGEEEDDNLGEIDLDSDEEGSEDDGVKGKDDSSFGGFSSSDEDSDDDGDNGIPTIKKKKNRRPSQRDEDPMEITSDEDDRTAPGGQSSDEESSDYSAISRSPSPKRKSKSRKAAADTGRPVDSTFLPSLMGGYISGSGDSSASDLDIAPPRKNRRGQRARQAIWEKKYKAEAKHLLKPQKTTWDPKRGAVEGGSRTPWKAGVGKNVFDARTEAGGGEERKPRKPRQTMADKPGPLHPSWEAKKKAAEKAQTAAFAGTKIRFD